MLRHGPGGVPGRYDRIHRGGYTMAAFSLELMKKELKKRDLDKPWAHHFRDKVTSEDYFSRCIKICETVTPLAEEEGVKIALHTDDPPIPDREGLLPGITDPLMITRLFESVPSKNLGLLFCCGTRYESGLDIYKQIRMFGEKNKIFHVHLRNVRGTIPSAREYEEVSIDEGDMNIFRIVQTLKEIGYDKRVYPDHVPTLIGDEKRRAALAFAVGYVKAVFSMI
jgi:mannonate dehydratase